METLEIPLHYQIGLCTVFGHANFHRHVREIESLKSLLDQTVVSDEA